MVYIICKIRYNYKQKGFSGLERKRKMNSIKRFFGLDIVKEIIWTLIIFTASLAWSLALMLCVDFMLFAYNSIKFWQFAAAAFVIALVITIYHIYTTVQKYKKGDKSVL